MDEDLSYEDKEAIYKYLSESQTTPMPEDTYSVHTFLHKVATSNDTTKVGNLDSTELGLPNYSERSLKEFALIAKDIIGNNFVSQMFQNEAENLTATSLSKNGFLVQQATTTTRRIADVTKPKTENKGWFKKKETKENDIQ